MNPPPTIQQETAMRGRILMTACMLLAAAWNADAQTFATGTLSLRNGQAQSVGLTIPTTGVTPYTILLPNAIGAEGQVMTITNVTGTTATLSWTTADFWGWEGSAITTGGTAVGQQYMGTSNAQDLVLATNGSERLRVIGVAGPTQGYTGFGTASPLSLVDIRGDLTVSSNGPASLVRFMEPSADGANFTAFRAGAQTADITYTLPATAPANDGMVLTATAGGVMEWRSQGTGIPKGSFAPANVGDFLHVIPTTGHDLQVDDLPFVTVISPSGYTFAAVVKSIDAANNTVTVETSVGITPSERILWLVLPK
jgi:hypothetical protein